MTSRPALVSRQFNTPMKLYSPENVADSLNKQTQVLANGALGIDFHHLAAPGNLANSAVLRMLEEEAQKEGKENKFIEYSKPRRRVQRFDWPPKRTDRLDDNNNDDQNNNNSNNHNNNNNVNNINKTNNNGTKISCSFLNRPQSIASSYNICTGAGLKRIAWPPLPEEQANHTVNLQPTYAQASVNNVPLSPNSIQQQNTWTPQTNPLSPLRQQPQQPLLPSQQPQQPAYQQQQLPTQQQSQPFQQQPGFQQPSVNQEQSQQPPVFQRIVQTAAPIYEPVKAPVFQPPPSYVTLRQEAPVRQASAPVFESQPAATRGLGPRMRGDQKWPPAENKAQTAAENAARQALAKGPAVRPRAVKKDYSKFFAQNAITTTYPGYRAPPGTQHYVEEGTSNF